MGIISFKIRKLYRLVTRESNLKTKFDIMSKSYRHIPLLSLLTLIISVTNGFFLLKEVCAKDIKKHDDKTESYLQESKTEQATEEIKETLDSKNKVYPDNIHKEWEENLSHEIAFWERWIETEGFSCKEEYKERTNPESKLQDFFLKYIDRTVEKNTILDVGSGPFTSVNKKCDFVEIEIYAIDPLADVYNEILKKYNIQPLVKVQKCDGERLTEKFAENTFDIAYSRNAIDHAYNPIKCIEEMIKVTKKNHYIIIQVFEREGSYERWQGLHKWDFFIERNYLGEKHFYLQRREGRTIDVTDFFRDVAEVVSITKKDREITVVLKKL